MNLQAHFILLADYNAWMNDKVYAAAGKLPAAEVAAERGAFFGSLLGTLNHLVVADTLWLQRFARHPGQEAVLAPVAGLPMPTALDQLLFEQLPALAARRRVLDAAIQQWVASLREETLGEALRYRNTKGVAMCKPLSAVLLHFFNHQTHHRGQASTLLFQAGQDVGVTDLLSLIPAAAGG